jgi:hypothetical protein
VGRDQARLVEVIRFRPAAEREFAPDFRHYEKDHPGEAFASLRLSMSRSLRVGSANDRRTTSICNLSADLTAWDRWPATWRSMPDDGVLRIVVRHGTGPFLSSLRAFTKGASMKIQWNPAVGFGLCSHSRESTRPRGTSIAKLGLMKTALCGLILVTSSLLSSACVVEDDALEADELETGEEEVGTLASTSWVTGGYVRSSPTPLGLEAWGEGYAGASTSHYKVCVRAMLQFYIAGWVMVEINTKCRYNASEVSVLTEKTGCPAIGGANMRTRVHGWAQTSTGLVVHDKWADSPTKYCPAPI